MNVSRQIPFEFKASAKKSFDNFVCAASNIEVISMLKNFPAHNENFVYLWGNTGVGKSHCLKSVCHLFPHSAYVSLVKHKNDGAGILDSLHFLDLVCIDDVELVLPDQDWEEALFRLYNEIKSNGGRLVISAENPPRQLQCILPDLQSRFSWGVTYQLHELDDEGKIANLKNFIAANEIAMNDDALEYIYSRSKRDLPTLHELLQKLDILSRGAKRIITIPFIKEVMDW